MTFQEEVGRPRDAADPVVDSLGEVAFVNHNHLQI